MPRTVAELLAFHFKRTNARLLRVAGELDDAQLRRQWPHANSIGFDVWHCGRWADHLQMLVPQMTAEIGQRLGNREQIWVRDGLAGLWGYPAEKLGQVETGMGMDESLAATLPLPEKAVLLAYVGRAFAALEDALAILADSDLMREAAVADEHAPWLRGEAEKGPVGNWVLSYDEHENRHLGMIEARRGMLGLRGTATA